MFIFCAFILKIWWRCVARLSKCRGPSLCKVLLVVILIFLIVSCVIVEVGVDSHINLSSHGDSWWVCLKIPLGVGMRTCVLSSASKRGNFDLCELLCRYGISRPVLCLRYSVIGYCVACVMFASHMHLCVVVICSVSVANSKLRLIVFRAVILIYRFYFRLLKFLCLFP